MRLIVQESYAKLSKWVAHYIARAINDYQATQENPFVLGLPTGSSPVGTYKELVELVQAGKVSFDNVITFNMDEYVGIPEGHPESYHSFMRTNLFEHIGMPLENINILDGNAADLEEECRRYEEKILAVGGIDLFLGGIGPDGHIAFNEPGSSLHSRTRIKTLTYDTRIANSRFFGNAVEKVPKLALTVGVGTVTDAKEVILIVNGHIKARALHKIIEEGVNHMWTASALQLHPKSMIVCNIDATAELSMETVRYFRDIEKDNLDPCEL